ncbi:hypothetical protein [Thermodesulfitimonas sp.]
MAADASAGRRDSVRREPGYWFRRVKGARPAVDWRAVPGYEARRFKAGARVIQTVRALPWWAKVLPVAVAIAVAVGFSSARVFGNPLPASGGFSDTETVTLTFTVACPERGCGGHGNCAGNHNGSNDGNGGGCGTQEENNCGGQAASAAQGSGPAADGSGAPLDSANGGTVANPGAPDSGPAPQNAAPGSVCDRATANAALAAGN